MLDGKKEEHIDKTESKGASFSQSKRKLVKSGALAVPVVLTLRSGAAVALSSAKQCIDNNQKEAQGADPLITQGEVDDQVWVRKIVECRLLENNNGDRFYVYKNPEEPVDIDNPGKWLREDDNAVFIDVETKSNEVRKKRNSTRDVMEVRKKQRATKKLMIEEAALNDPNGNPTTYTVISEDTGCKVLVLVDSQGNVVKYGRSGIDEVAITTSCWASINANVP